MNATSSAKPSMKQKATHEAKELLYLFLYLSFFFCSLAAYSNLLLRDYIGSYLTYGFALLNALVVAKVILIGDLMHLGKRAEHRSLFVAAITKSVLFGLFVLAFHFLEEVIKALVHGRDIASAFHDIPTDQLLARSVIVFATFIPLFGFRELRQVMGEEEFDALLFRAQGGGKPTDN